MSTPAEITAGAVSVADVRDYLNQNSTGFGDALLGRILATSVDSVRSIIGQPFLATAGWEHTFEGAFARVHTIDYFPVSDLTKIEHWRGVNDWEELDEDLFEIVGVDGVYRLYTGGTFTRGDLYRATFTVGYAIADIPAEIIQVIIEMAAMMLAESGKGDGRLGLQSVGTNDSGVNVSTSTSFKDLRPRWIEMLKPYTVVPRY
jgi:hypothetical protein